SPVLTVDSGERVTISAVSGEPGLLPGPGFTVRPALLAIHEQVSSRLPGHICTGPVAVRGAKPGHVLQVDIERIELIDDWGYNVVRPLAGALPYDFDEQRLTHIPL